MARLGELLVARGACTAEQVAEALENQVIYGGRIGTNLVELGAVDEEALAQALGVQQGCPALWGDIGADPRALALVKADLAERLGLVPLRLEGRRLAVLAADPRDLSRIDELAFATGKDLRVVVVAESRLDELLRRHYGLHRPERGVQVAASRAAPVRHE